MHSLSTSIRSSRMQSGLRQATSSQRRGSSDERAKELEQRTNKQQDHHRLRCNLSMEGIPIQNPKSSDRDMF